MSIEDFKHSLTGKEPPNGMKLALQAVWFDGKGDWEKAHTIAQDIHAPEGYLIHAYLHRKEGDLGNASYWYSRAKREVPSISFEEEWEILLKQFLQ